MSAKRNNNFKGSTSARFVKNSKPHTIRSNFANRSGAQEADPYVANNPMLNDSLQKRELVDRIDRLDSLMGFDRLQHGEQDGNKPRKGWLINMHSTTIPSDDYLAGYSGVDYYFLDQEGGSFKVTYQFDPYFFLSVRVGSESEVEEMLKRFLETSNLKTVGRLYKEDLALPNHLVGLKKCLLKLTFHNVTDLLTARRLLAPIIKDNLMKKDSRDIYHGMNLANANYNEFSSSKDGKDQANDPLILLEDIREYDVPYHVRVSIDKDLRVGKWYNVWVKHSIVTFEEDKETIAFPDPVILAFDIETTKAPLKFPDSRIDQVMMISYMIDGEGFLITNREIISEDIEDFEYTPKPEYPGVFTIFNEPDEKSLLLRFFEHIRDARPTVIATFNGDFFDWPFVETRSRFHDLDMFDEIGFAKDNDGEYKSKYCVHMDCYRWVKRDSYLPQGSQGLKAVTTAKLGYNPTELDPELMTPYAYERPQYLSEYSVSDAVATYYLYYKYVHPFIFSLCTIIPLNPDEVLRKGTGTLCEMLLMVQAYHHGIVLPNKYSDPVERFYNGHLLESETYVGGHVESLEAGVFRSDIPTQFKMDTTAIDELINDLPKALRFFVEVESKKKMDDIENFDEVLESIKAELMELKNNPVRHEVPLIYHVDVASMYPNIMTSNRLQPDSMKSEEDCASCDFNRPGKSCDRRLQWSWRGEYLPAEMNEYGMIKRSLQNETFPAAKPWLPPRSFEELSYSEQATRIKKRLSDYSRKVYHKVKQTETITRESIVCQRENPFYVNTVRDFRDRRYEFKGLAKVWKGKASKIDKSDTIGKDEAKKMVVLYDSLQLAHKVILNSFYGYVMRKGSRWYSMEMAGITCLTGSTIIQMARGLVERLGRPLELDTDGIWCILPKSFPENFPLNCKDGKKLVVEYPCTMLNYIVHEKFTNHQYQDLVDPDTFKYETHSENSIFFEVDGPYKAMILPTSKEEGKGLKKRYAVFNDDGSLAELKGFELKRRGELQLIKNFQSDIFKLFLEGDTLDSCYAAVASVANNWLDVLDTKGGMLEDEDLIELICENRSMSKSLAEYGDQKSTSITTAKRLGEFLGEEMVKDAGLATKYIISAKPIGSPVTERAVPVSIFSSDKKEYFLKKWLKDPSLTNFDPRSVIDWDYYYERLASVVQKIITIPAALQDVKNPVPRVPHPEWLQRRISTKEDKKQQSSLTAFFQKPSDTAKARKIKDMEDFGNIASEVGKAKVGKVTSRKRKLTRNKKLVDTEEDEERDNAILNGPCPDMLVDYEAFLIYQKAKWKVQEKSRERRKKLFGQSSESSQRSSVGGLIRRQAENVAGSDWQILEYKEDPNKPGDLKVFIIASGKVHSFNFHIPKRLYASFKTELDLSKVIVQGDVEKSNAILPNGHDGTNLYKFTMPQSVYQQEISNVDSILNSSKLLGLYESKMKPIERAIIDLGNSVKFDDTRVGTLGKGLKNGFNVKDMMQVNNANYLKRFGMDILYILHLTTNSYEFFTIFKSWENEATMFVLKPSAGAQELTGNMDKIYRDLFLAKEDKLGKMYNIIEYPNEMKFNVTYFNDNSKLFKKLDKTIAKINESKSNKALLTIQSPYTDRLLSILGSTANFPTVKMNVNSLSLPAVGWHSLVTKRVVNHFFVLASWMKNLISLSKYGNIPICNLQAENISYLIDIEYARRLSNSNMVLWWSDTPLADHGGFEMDKAPDYENLDFPVINNPEIYETACLEIDIGTLSINTILTSSIINEAEGADLVDEGTVFDNNNGASTLMEDSFGNAQLNVLRSMVKNWWDDALNNDINADSMMNHLVSWIQRNSSYLYDFALHYHIHNLTTKALYQLIGEFKRMNANVVFANRNKIFIQTSKVSVENSYAYGHYIVKAARAKPLFSFLEMEIVKYWDILLWMDEYNFGGRYCTQITNDEIQDLRPVNNWQLQQFLPVIFQNEFEDWLIIFLDALTKFKSDTLKGPTQANTPRVTQIAHILKGQRKLDSQDDNEEADDDFHDGVTEMFRKQLFKRVKSLFKKQTDSIINPELQKEYEFPKLPGSHLHLRNPCLQLVKFFCAIMGLSTKRSIEVRVLRQELLSIFEIREFSNEAAFHNPSSSLVIPQVICDHCSYTRDIDVCRDPEKAIWSCTMCNKSYNRVAIEEELVTQFSRYFTKFLRQDMKCSKCNQIKSNNLSEYCQCSGKWEETVSYLELEKRIHVFQNVAATYNLQLLRGVVEELTLA
ncbi:DNA polymerase epsilon catalytic subunit [Yamadazyma tenuis]|uniref:DNA polymerase epsilon catalytic subunit n=1 Tax=Candida tenuis (strain ATCC 10573 / BCRC 21748 / CBS 615 / JCM 9827 / NBRC 10315 / NRRL Y-1498 / VKM Y-70) TaxID=590646 RepID=G3B805_CANTC|nr:DNA-directed DNA polymerase epsilon, catalytic subunit A [Yamadazyma tenuis ATCC 10573]EGV61700.1 DNA-directed DNA polymerase epsilon, catalytic subunit A [Yamadazyma tenuis ATCC 10573]WEJ92929.1 DNA polymerase epsilon catalytic subunit [Yamadazyma tenuis]